MRQGGWSQHMNTRLRCEGRRAGCFKPSRYASLIGTKIDIQMTTMWQGKNETRTLILVF